MTHPAGRPLTQVCAALMRALPGFCLCFFLASGPVQAQDLQRGASRYTLPPGSMPPWTVPVLRLVSSTYVEPTTGIVISDSGLVLVPEDFASMGDEIVVLDGGTDIIRNGRPARIERKFSGDGLQVLFVQGLTRRGVTFAAGEPGEGSEVVLTAFPPAEQIAEGEPPLSIPASTVFLKESGSPAISTETALPNVTGGIVDSCGNLVGVSLAADVQSMQPSPDTRYLWRNRLLSILGEMQIKPPVFDCTGDAIEPLEEPEADEIPAEELPAEEPEITQSEMEQETVPEDEPAGDLALQDENTSDEPLEPQEKELPVAILPPIEQDLVEDANTEGEAGTRKWPWLIAALAFFGLGLLIHRLRQSRRSVIGRTAVTEKPFPVSVQDGEEEADLPHPVPGSILLIRGTLADGTSFEDSFPVSEQAINVTIGRRDADLKIDSPAVSRRHANLNGTSRELTVTDLGSSNGTSINGVPCLEGEIMFISPGDVLVLGNARCTIEIKPGDSRGSGRD